LEVVVEVNVTDCPTTDGLGADTSVVDVAVLAGLTICGEAASSPLLPSQPPVPLNVAAIVWLPTASAAVLKEACPAPSTATFDASTVEPSANVTVPVGAPPLPATVAVNVAVWPRVEGFGAELTVVVVEPCATTDAQLLTWNGQVRTRYPYVAPTVRDVSVYAPVVVVAMPAKAPPQPPLARSTT
jgi:hypothetical protein